DELNPPVSIPGPWRRWRAALWALAGLTATGAAAAIGWLVFGPAVPQPPQQGPNPPAEIAKAPSAVPEIPPEPRAVLPIPGSDLLAGFAVLPMATDSDVVLDRVPEFHAGWLPVGEHPFSGVMALATAEEVLLEGVGPSPVWPTGGPKMTNAPGDAPM